MSSDTPPRAEFDHHSADFHEHRRDRWRELRRTPVAYNPNYGGFWMVTGFAEVAQVSRDGETFSSKFVPEPEDGIAYVGITGIPRVKSVPPAGIAEVEGPVHHALRRVLNPYLLPAAVDALTPLMERTAGWFLDQKIESGRIDLVLDFANPVPAVLTMLLIGLPASHWNHYAELFHATIAHRPSAPEYQRAIARVPDMVAELLAEAEDRRRHPRADLLSDLVGLELDGGRPLSDAEISSVLWNLVGGGLDTTTSLTALTLHHLHLHPDLRTRLIEEPALLASATEEFLRYFSVNETLTRTVTRDVELGGQRLARGDHVLISWLSANLDEAEFVDADRVVLDRAPNRHLAFGVGPHRCIGMHLARSLFAVLIRAVLGRLPDYRVDEAGTRFYAGNPELAGVVTLPATFTPGAVVGPPERPF